MRKSGILIILPFFIMTAILSSCNKNQQSSKTKESTKVVAVMPLSGEATKIGQSSKNGLEQLSDELNKKNIQVVYLDDESNSSGLTDSLKALINKEKIKAVLLCTQSTSAAAVAKLASDSKIPIINATAPSSKVMENGGDNIFLIPSIDTFQGEAMAQFTSENLRKKRVAILYNTDDDYSINIAFAYKNKIEKAGGSIVALEGYKKNTSDFSESLGKIKNTSPEALFLPDYYYDVEHILAQAKVMNLNTIFLGSDGWDNSELFGNTNFQGSYFTSQFSAQEKTPDSAEFIKAYDLKNKTLPDSFAALTYDAGKLMMSSLEKLGTGDVSKLKDIIEKTNLEGVTGKISFDSTGKTQKGILIMKIDNNKSVIENRIMP